MSTKGPRNRTTRVYDMLVLGGAESLGIIAAIKNAASFTGSSVSGGEAIVPILVLAAMEGVDALDNGATPFLAEGIGGLALGVGSGLIALRRTDNLAIVFGTTVLLTGIGVGSFIGLRVLGNAGGR